MIDLRQACCPGLNRGRVGHIQPGVAGLAAEFGGGRGQLVDVATGNGHRRAGTDAGAGNGFADPGTAPDHHHRSLVQTKFLLVRHGFALDIYIRRYSIRASSTSITPMATGR